MHILHLSQTVMHALKAKAEGHPAREIRHLDFITQFSSDIPYVEGQDNQEADGLTQLKTNIIQQSIVNIEALGDNQRTTKPSCGEELSN